MEREEEEDVRKFVLETLAGHHNKARSHLSIENLRNMGKTYNIMKAERGTTSRRNSWLSPIRNNVRVCVFMWIPVNSSQEASPQTCGPQKNLPGLNKQYCVDLFEKQRPCVGLIAAPVLRPAREDILGEKRHTARQESCSVVLDAPIGHC